MSDFCNDPEARKARKDHRCTYCGEQINKGNQYTHQTGVADAGWFTSKFHPECFEDLIENGDGEFTPFSNERPVKETP